MAPAALPCGQMPPLTQNELDTFEYKLRKRGFRRDDVFLHECPACSEKAVDVALHTDRDPHERISEDSAYARNPQLNDGCLITKLRPQIFDNNEANTL